MKIYFTTGQGYKKRVFKKVGVCIDAVKEEPGLPCPCDVPRSPTQTKHLITLKLNIPTICNLS